MTDENSALDDQSGPHTVDEDPEQFMGKLLKDPWSDKNQDDWSSPTLDDEVISNE